MTLFMFCTNCGDKIKDGTKFCTNCGKTLAEKKADFPVQTKLNEHPAPVHTPVTERVIKNTHIDSKKNQIMWWVLGVIGGIIIIAIIIPFIPSWNIPTQKVSDIGNTQSVVDINCDNGKGGSGTIFTADGTVLTNNHVIVGSKSCEVTIPDATTGRIAEIYDAVPIITPTLSKKYDVATVKIDAAHTDSDGKTWGTYPTTFSPFVLPSTCDTSVPSKLGDSVRIYGYPVTSGGYNLTITDGIISSFANNGDILTSAQVDSGNSGGLAVDQNGCWLGIPSAVVSGNYQNLGVIISGNVVQTILSSVPAKLNLAATSTDAVAAESAATPQESNEQICENTFGTNSQWNGTVSQEKPMCVCQTGYGWDSTGNSCELKTSLLQECQNSYGSGSYSYTQSGKAVCGCSTGYTWNSDQTACVVVVQKTGYQVCDAMNATWDGSSYTSDGSYSCSCDAGYISSSDGASCVPQPSCPIFSSYNSSTGQCSCNSGYTKSGSMCESNLTYCQNLNGYGASYDSSTNSCTCSSGYIYSGGQCQMGSLYCSSKYGLGSEYDYSTGGCGCMAGYSSNGNRCVSNYSGY